MSSYSEDYLREKLTKELSAEKCEVKDLSDGCGAKFEVLIVSSQFEGKPLLARHRLVNSVLETELKTIHAFSQKTLTPQQWKENAAAIAALFEDDEWSDIEDAADKDDHVAPKPKPDISPITSEKDTRPRDARRKEVELNAENEVKIPITPEFHLKSKTVEEICKSSFHHGKTRMSQEAVKLASEVLRVYTLEALARATNQWRTQGDSEKVSLEHLEKVLPQFLLDFS